MTTKLHELVEQLVEAQAGWPQAIDEEAPFPAARAEQLRTATTVLLCKIALAPVESMVDAHLMIEAVAIRTDSFEALGHCDEDENDLLVVCLGKIRRWLAGEAGGGGSTVPDPRADRGYRCLGARSPR